MLDKFFTKPLELNIREQTLKFCSVADFEFSMASKTAVHPAKISELLKLSMEQLNTQQQALKETEVPLLSILSRAIDEPAGIDRALRELDLLFFSQDHGWRNVIKALNEGDEACNPLRRAALAKYLQYLSALQETIGYICAEKKQHLKAPSQDFEEASHDFKATVAPEHIFSEPSPEPQREEEFERLPKGKAVPIRLMPGHRFDVVLAIHKCQLMAIDDRIQFSDQAGRRTILRKGRNLIGRGSDSTVKIDPDLRDVSRLHLVIHNPGDHTLALTDLSSAGTSIAARFLKH